MESNLQKMAMALTIIAFELKALISVSYDKNACEQPSTC